MNKISESTQHIIRKTISTIIVFILSLISIYYVGLYITAENRMSDILSDARFFLNLNKSNTIKKHYNYEILETKQKNIYLRDNLFHIEIKDGVYFFINGTLGYEVGYVFVIMKPLKSLNQIFGLIAILALMFYINHFWNTIKHLENKELDNIIKLQGAEAKLSSKNMSLLAENIHHELKTPLMIIHNNIEEIKTHYEELICLASSKFPSIALNEMILESKEIVEKCKNCRTKKDCLDCVGVLYENKIINSLDLITTHVDVIYNLLDRMKNFKNIKRSTMDKTIYEVVDIAFKTLLLFTKTEFEYRIDSKLRNYKLEIIKNEDILNIFINYIKNSLEANSTIIEINLLSYSKRFGILELVDNGNGIPKKIQDDLFKPHFSTKNINKENGESRGIGLYLSRVTLNTFNGNTWLNHSSEYGSSFSFKIPMRRRS